MSTWATLDSVGVQSQLNHSAPKPGYGTFITGRGWHCPPLSECSTPGTVLVSSCIHFWTTGTFLPKCLYLSVFCNCLSLPNRPSDNCPSNKTVELNKHLSTENHRIVAYFVFYTYLSLIRQSTVAIMAWNLLSLRYWVIWSIKSCISVYKYIP